MHVSVHQFWKKTALQFCTQEKNNKRFSKIPALPPTTQIKAANLSRLYVCMHTINQMEIRTRKKSPCRNNLCNCKSLVTSSTSCFALSAWWRSCQVLSKEIWTWLALSFCEDISQHFRDGREREEIILQQGITLVPLNSLNKQQEVWPEAENGYGYDFVSFFPKSSASVFFNSLRLWIPGNCILEQIKK